MRYFLLHRKEEYYILPQSPVGIVALAIFSGAESIASITATSEKMAHRHLTAIACFHSIRSSEETTQDDPLKVR